ncbi:MAG: GntR family transcriptional regulator [Chloroflexi bacterium]|nr:GntR family transcriptional regulator [Chloroflexota bacterium]
MSPQRRPHQAQEIEAVLQTRLREFGEAEGRLPSETDLAKEFGVSRVTVREALASLERRGLVFRKHGVGTFVNGTAVNIRTRLDESVEFGQLIRAANYEPELGFLDCRVEPAGLEVAAHLQMEAGEPVLCIRKVFKASGTPVIYCMNAVPVSLIPNELHVDLSKNVNPELSIYTVLERWFNQQVAFQLSDVSACVAGDETGAMLNCSPTTALLHLEDVGFNGMQQPVLYADIYYIPGPIQFQLVRRPIYTLEEST